MRKLAIMFALLALLVVPAMAQAKSRAVDRDHDKLSDRWEKKFKLSTKKNSARADIDHDGLNNLAEFQANTNPRAKDTDRDRIGDADEDADRDHVDNGNEAREGTNPRARDTDRDRIGDAREDRDHDGLSNGDEDLTGNDPTDRDSDGDGVRDGDETAGVVRTFQGGVLTIDLAKGGSVSGTVTEDTDIECGSEDGEAAARDSRAMTSVLGDDDGGDDGDSGDDPGDDPGDDGEDGDDGSGDSDGSCSAASLVSGARVESADLSLTDGVLEFDSVSLVR